MQPSLLKLTAVIAAHPEGQVVGRTRLQKTVYLLQRVGLPTAYDYTLFFYGPYSEALQMDVRHVVAAGLVTEEQRVGEFGPYFVYTATLDGLPFKQYLAEWGLTDRLALLAQAEAPVLELAATYDAFRQLGYSADDALHLLRRKKGQKCDEGRQNQALQLLERLQEGES